MGLDQLTGKFECVIPVYMFLFEEFVILQLQISFCFFKYLTLNLKFSSTNSC